MSELFKKNAAVPGCYCYPPMSWRWSLEEFLWKKSPMLIVWVSHKKPINHHSGNGIHRKQGSTASPVCCRYVLSSVLCHLFLGHLESSFVVFQVWLVGFLTKMSNLHHILFFSYTLSHSMISEDCTRGCGSGRCLICVSLWWQKALVTHLPICRAFKSGAVK